MNLEELSLPFRPDELEWRIQSSGTKKDGKPWAKVLVYIQARAVFNRLDKVCGPENWKNTEPKPVYGTRTLYAGKKTRWDNGSPIDYQAYSYNQSELKEATAYDTQESVLLGFNMGLSIKIGDEWVTRWDGSDVTDVEPYKGGISSAVKRAAVPWGIGRYLYEFGESWAHFDGDGSAIGSQARNSTMSAYVKGKYYNWLPPQIEQRFLPEDWDWNADQHAHLMKGDVRPALPQKKEKSEPAASPAGSHQKSLLGDSDDMTKCIKRLTELNKAAHEASEKGDAEQINNARDSLKKGLDYFGSLFADGKIDDREHKQLQQMARSVSAILGGK